MYLKKYQFLSLKLRLIVTSLLILTTIDNSYARYKKKTHSTYRFILPSKSSIQIYLNDVYFEIAQIKNVSRGEVNYSIGSDKNNVIITGVAGNNKTTTQVFVYTSIEKTGFIRFDNIKNVLIDFFVTIWYTTDNESKIYDFINKPTIIPDKMTYQTYGSEICQTPESINDDYHSYLFYNVKKNQMEKNYNVLSFDATYNVGNENFFEEALTNKRMFNEMENVMSDAKTKLNNFKEQLSVLSNDYVFNSVKYNLSMQNAIDHYRNIVFNVNGKEVMFAPNLRRRHVYLKSVRDFVDLQLEIYEIGLLASKAIDLRTNLTKNLNNVTTTILRLENDYDLTFVKHVNIFLNSSVRFFNDHVKNLIDNLYDYAYEDSIVQSTDNNNVYDAVATAHNIILEHGVLPLRDYVEKFSKIYNVDFDFKLADFTGPHLYFSSLFGVQTFDSLTKAKTMIEENYAISFQELPLQNSVHTMKIQLNAENELVDIINFHGYNVTEDVIKNTHSKFINPSSPLRFSLPKFFVHVLQPIYIKKVDICLFKVNDWLTIIKHVKFYKSNGVPIDVVANEKKEVKNEDLICRTYEMMNHSIYRINVFYDTCTLYGNAVSVGVVYKRLE